jgi:hypothetical protein
MKNKDQATKDNIFEDLGFSRDEAIVLITLAKIKLEMKKFFSNNDLTKHQEEEICSIISKSPID